MSILYIALAHTIISIGSGPSSIDWDSISEVIGLALNSHPATELQNTCAGIQTTETFEHRVRVAATTGTSDREPNGTVDDVYETVGHHLELLLLSNDRLAVSKVRVGGEYGRFKC